MLCSLSFCQILCSYSSSVINCYVLTFGLADGAVVVGFPSLLLSPPFIGCIEAREESRVSSLDFLSYSESLRRPFTTGNQR